MSKYRKFLVALGGLFAVGSSVLADGLVTSDEYETIAFALISAVLVYLVPNKAPDA